MSELKVFDDLQSLLSQQLGLFESVFSLQESLIELLNSSTNFPKVMELLAQKEKLVSEIAKNSEEHKPFIADWMQRKSEFSQNPKYDIIEQQLNQIEQSVSRIQVLDEQMLAFFQSKDNSEEDNNPLNLIHAYRGLR